MKRVIYNFALVVVAIMFVYDIITYFVPGADFSFNLLPEIIIWMVAVEIRLRLAKKSMKRKYNHELFKDE